jgi:hypothetical protein
MKSLRPQEQQKMRPELRQKPKSLRRQEQQKMRPELRQTKSLRRQEQQKMRLKLRQRPKSLRPQGQQKMRQALRQTKSPPRFLSRLVAMVGVSTDGQKRANMKRSEDMCPSEPKRLHVCNKQHSSSQSALSAKNGISVVRRMGSRSVLSRREAVYIPPPKPPPPPKVNPLIASSSQARRPLGPLILSSSSSLVSPFSQRSVRLWRQ